MLSQSQHSGDADVQYRFTAYIGIAFRNHKADYYDRWKKINSSEVLFGDPPDDLELIYSTQSDSECDWDEIKGYIGNEKLLAALSKLSEAESIIIFMRLVRQMTPSETAGNLGKNMSAFNKMYYRAISKLRREMGYALPRGEQTDEFCGNTDGGEAE